MTKYKIQDCDFITELCAGPKYMQYEYPKEAFASAVYKNFEGYQMPIPVGYEQYLKIAFGAYETLPPIKARVPHHEVVYLDLTRSCYDFDRKELFSEEFE